MSQLPSDSAVTFTTKYKPYQLYPEASQEGEDKYQWYKKSRYGDSEDKMQKYTTVMSALGADQDINFRFGGTVANTLHAHRVIQHFQETKGSATADKIVSSLYKQYFEEEKHPSSDETLLRATTEAGIDEHEAKAFIEDKDEGMMETKMLVREQVGNQVDAVPYIVIEGKRRDHTIEGAREVDEYLNVLKRVIKESS